MLTQARPPMMNHLTSLIQNVVNIFVGSVASYEYLIRGHKPLVRPYLHIDDDAPCFAEIRKGSYDDMASGGKKKCQQEDSRGKESGRRKR